MTVYGLEPGALYVALTSVASTAQVLLVPPTGLQTIIRAKQFAPLDNVTLGLAVHVPLKTHQKTLVRFLVAFRCVRAVQVCPPAWDIAIVPDVAPAQAWITTNCPAVMPDGGVRTVGEVVFVPLSAGLDTAP